jgi:arabinogalactan endo-1,4-beta-galactosidase
MKSKLGLWLLASACWGLMSCSSSSTKVEELEKEEIEVVDFYKGADISWVTELESKGHKFYNANGDERECTALMKEYGMNAIRLRVWVDPKEHGNWCNKEDVLVKAKRAKALSMEVMVDFHYSDWWADPAKQNIPASWKGHSYEEMKKDLANHTKEVLQFLKNNGITPKWVQVGNETTNGMLWSVKTNEQGWEIKDENGNTTITESMGHATRNPEQYAGFFKAGYESVKEIFPDAIVIVHLDNGWDENLYNWNLDILKNHGAKFDMIGMSLYPYWSEIYHNKTAEQTISGCMANIKKMKAKYGCDVMIVETGMLCADEQGKLASASVLEEGYKQLARIIKESKEVGCKGVFYWEPECKPSQYKLGAFTEDGFPTRIMDAFKE